MRHATVLILALLLLGPAVAAAAPAQPATTPAAPLAAPASDDATARQLVRQLPVATAVNDGDGDKVFDALEARFAEAAPGARLPVVVVGVAGADASGLLSLARDAAGRDFPAPHGFTIVPGFSARLTLAEALAVAALPEVRQVEWSPPGVPELATATVVEGVRAVQEQLNVTGDLDGLPAFTAADVNIAVLDTGIDGDHVDFGDGKIVHFEDIGGGEGATDAYDSGSHGTHVASIAAGLGRGAPGMTGVAPGAGVVGVKITGSDDTYATTIEAVEWVVAHREALNIRVLTLSFGFGYTSDGTSALELAMDAAWDAGVACFKSTGNSGPGRGTVTIPGGARGIIGVGAILDPAGTRGGVPLYGPTGTPGDDPTRGRGFQLAPFSSRGPTTDGRVKPDLVAPGVSIEAAGAGTGDGYYTYSGTSMASPFTAGVAALMLSANPDLTPDEVRSILKGTAEDWGVAGPDVDFGAGRVDALAAVGEALARAGAPVPATVAPPVIPRHGAHFGSLDATGGAVETVEVEDAGRPVALTFIVEGSAAGVVVRDPGGAVVAEGAAGSPLDRGSRQVSVGFNATEAGAYSVHLAGSPADAYSLDVSFDAHPAPSLMGLVDRVVGEVVDPTGDAGVAGDVTVPAAGAAWAAVVLTLAAMAVARRRR